MTTPSKIQSNIETQVMASVGVVYTTRKLFAPTALKLYVLVLATLAIWRLVWVTRIEQNFLTVMHGGVVAVGQYVLSAFTHTSTVVQLVSFVAIAALGSLLVDVARSTSRSGNSSYSY